MGFGHIQSGTTQRLVFALHAVRDMAEKIDTLYSLEFCWLKWLLVTSLNYFFVMYKWMYKLFV